MSDDEIQLVRIADDGPVRTVTINRAARRNAIDRPTAQGLLDAFQDFAEDDRLSVAILTGSDGCFCAGADLQAITEGKGNRVTPDGPGPLGPTRLQLAKPVIAAIEGFAVAGGLELALWCDLRVAASNATFGVYCRRWGVPLVDGGTVRLPRLIGQSRAMDMVLTGRGVSGDEAYQMGLANRVCSPGDALRVARELAQALAALPQQCLRSDRRSLLEQWSLGEDAALHNEFRLGSETIASGETLRGAMRFAQGAGRHGAP